MYLFFKVVCLLYVTRIGLTEAEILEILEIPQNLWPPVFYGLEKYILLQSGFLK